MTLHILARTDRFHEVWLDDNIELCDGATEMNDAIGRLVRRYPELFNIEKISIEQGNKKSGRP